MIASSGVIMMENKELIKKCIRKDPEAWGIFIDRFSKTIYWSIEDRLMRYRLKYTRHDIDDIYQEVILSIWEKKKLKKVKEPQKVGPWLVMVAGNKALDYFRTKKKDQLRNISLVESIYEASHDEARKFEDILTSNEPDPSQQAQFNEIEYAVEESLKTLSESQRKILSLNILLGKKHREIAEILKIPEGTVSTVIARTKELLREKLSASGIRKVERKN